MAVGRQAERVLDLLFFGQRCGSQIDDAEIALAQLAAAQISDLMSLICAGVFSLCQNPNVTARA